MTIEAKEGELIVNILIQYPTKEPMESAKALAEFISDLLDGCEVFVMGEPHITSSGKFVIFTESQRLHPPQTEEPSNNGQSH